MKKQFAYPVIFIIAGVLMSCSGGTQRASALTNVEVRLSATNTEVVAVDTKGNVAKVIGKYPYFAGFDTRPFQSNGYILKFTDGNMVVLVPDPSDPRPIIAWNDLAHPFDVIFVNRDRRSITTLLKGDGRNITVKMGPSGETAFVFLVGENNTCTLRLVAEDGNVERTVHYSYTSFPDIAFVSKTTNGYLITHSNIDDEQTFLLNSTTGKIRSVSYKKHSMAH